MLDSILHYLSFSAEVEAICSHPEGAAQMLFGCALLAIGSFLGELFIAILAFICYRALSRDIRELKEE